MFAVESPSNYEQKSLCVLLLDTSYSMNGDKIESLQRGIEAFHSEILEDPTTSNRLEVAIVTYDSNVNIVQQPALVSDFEMPYLEAQGTTNMLEAIEVATDIVDARKSWYKATGQPYYRPWIITITDGEPTDENGYMLKNSIVIDAGNKIKSQVSNKNFFFFAIGVDGADMEILEDLSSPQMPPARLQGLKFAEFFKWLSASMTQVVASTEGEEVNMPSPANWMEGFTIA